ncbi:methyl-accepting chemotaxis protein [Spirochaeta cellobiosiphila]|uniref:methyl-accepting chemotaxis protein n=1 Tax=Spirochaeta cellobiosiphila TaxID=504483 RepID=UPI00040F5300|nr:methyl-accepting chemotaxis protein [Spirochaeta cellobiosiphila]
MRIKSKLIGFSSIFIFGMLVISLIQIVDQVLVGQLKDFQLELSKNIADWQNLRMSTNDLINSRSGYVKVKEREKEARQRLENSLLILETHPGRRLLREETQKKLEGIPRLYGNIENKLDTIETNFADLETSDVLLKMQTTDLKTVTLLMNEDIGTMAALSFSVLNNQIQSVLVFFETGIEIVTETRNYVDTEINKIQQIFLYISVGSFIFLSFLSILAGIRFASSLSQRLRLMEDAMKEVSSKNLALDIELKGKDEVSNTAKDLNSLIGSLKDFFGATQIASTDIRSHGEDISGATEETSVALNQIGKNISSIKTLIERIHVSVKSNFTSIKQISTNIDRLSDKTYEQSNRNDDTSASIEEMDASIKSIARLGSERKEQAMELKNVVNLGGEKVANTNQIITDVAKEIDSLLEITSLIKAVSQQTDLLSMNAAIESAHAGEAGRGFSVVAEEIRKLAENTSENAVQIDNSLLGMIEQIKMAQEAAHTSFDVFEQIKETADQLTEALTEIIENMSELSQGSQRILKSTSEGTEMIKAIRNESQSIDDQSKDIQETMRILDQISDEATLGIKEIELGVQEINDAMNNIKKLNISNQEKINHLDTDVRGFKLN